MEKSKSTTGHENESLVRQIEHQSGDYAPPIFFELANLLYREGNNGEAIFWFNAGRLRADFDADRCTDVSAQDAVSMLVMSVPIPLRKSQFNDLGSLKTIIENVIKWDEITPYNYEFRWVNLHGLDAMRSSLGNASEQPMTVSRDTWARLAQKNRDQYQKSLDDTLASAAKRKTASAGH